MPCNNCGPSGGSTVVRGGGAIQVGGSGTPTDPYIITQNINQEALRFTVRDSTTVDLQLTGAGTDVDPYVLRASTSGAAKLTGLGDVSATPVALPGRVPMWVGSTVAGHFELRTPGTRYTTNATRGSGLFQGEQIRETDTQKRFEWDGTQWVSLDPAIPSFALDGSVLQNQGGVTNTTDWNTLTTKSGIYRVNGGVTSGNNGPTGAYAFGTLVVVISGDSVTQTYYPQSVGTLYSRTKFGASDWTAWGAMASIAYVDSKVTSLGFTSGDSGIQLINTVSVNQPRLSKVANVSTLTFGVRTTTTVTTGGVETPGARILQLPTGFRPPYPIDFIASQNASHDNCPIAVDPDGGVRLRKTALPSGNEVYGSLSWVS